MSVCIPSTASWRQVARLARVAPSAPASAATPIRSISALAALAPSTLPGPSRVRAMRTPPPFVSLTHRSPETGTTGAHRSQGARRTATTLASTTPSSRPPIIPSSPSIDVTPPSLEAIRADEYADPDVQLVPAAEAKIVITPEAVTQLALITSREPPEVLSAGKLALRLSVDSGGCHGYQDTMSLTEERGVDDYVFQPHGVNCIPVVIDLVSLNLLKGATLHYATELIGSSFRIQNNPQAKDGGSCGCGVSWEAA